MKANEPYINHATSLRKAFSHLNMQVAEVNFSVMTLTLALFLQQQNDKSFLRWCLERPFLRHTIFVHINSGGMTAEMNVGEV